MRYNGKNYPRMCPCCNSRAKKGSGGWATEYNCGTRYGNLSQGICWRGIKCLEKEKGRLLTRRELTSTVTKIISAMTGMDMKGTDYVKKVVNSLMKKRQESK